ncbi:MAG: magnetosome biogenesis CDF transporter MamM [Magnetococcales bacterium]|nr:magnetosome biogenesis CDF transporter MamM [Magnetococcales bacterium]
MRYAKCVVCNEMVGWIGLFANLTLSVMKLFVGVISGSHALVADSLYSAKDVITSILIIVGLRVANRPIDQKHPFGHGKIEFLLSLVVSMVLMAITGVLFYYAADTLIEGAHQAPHLIALWTAGFSMVVNLFLQFYTRCVAVEINSPMVMTLSKHHKGDSLSSLAVMLAIVGSHYLGMAWLDTVVALGESVHLIVLGSEVAFESFKGLMDSAAPRHVVQKINRIAMGIKGVEEIESLRTRRIGQELWITMVVGVHSDLSIRDAKLISNRVEEELATYVPHVGDVCVHFCSQEGSVPELDLIKRQMVQMGEESVRDMASIEDDPRY